MKNRDKTLEALNHYKKLCKSYQEKEIFQDRIIDELRSTLIVAKPPKKFSPPKRDKSHKPQVAVQLFSDCQIGEKIQKKETGFNDYNIDVFKVELQRLFVSMLNIVERHRSDCRVDKLIMPMMGDIVEGRQIFKGQSARVSTDVVEQLFDAQYLIAEFIKDLASHFKEIYVPCVPGNHGRVGLLGEELAHVSWDYVLYRNLAQILSPLKNVTFDIDKKWWKIIDIGNWKFYMEHGDQVRRYLSVPWYSLERRDGRLTLMLESIGKSFDYYIIGHHHQPFTWDRPRGERICNGTFAIDNPYALRELATTARPTQKFFLVHPVVGISAMYNIRLDLPRDYIE